MRKIIAVLLCFILMPLVTVMSAHATPTGYPIVSIHGFGGGKACPGIDVKLYTSIGMRVIDPSQTYDDIGYECNDTDYTTQCATDNSNTPIEQVADDIANCLVAKYGTSPIVLVGLSMGGDVIRSMVTEHPELNVIYAVTVAGAMDGATNLNCPAYVQCQELTKGSAYLTTLHQTPIPQGLNGTAWVALAGGACDIYVSRASALDNPGAQTFSWDNPCYQHTGYPGDTKTALNATGRRNNVYATTYPHSAAEMVRAATLGVS